MSAKPAKDRYADYETVADRLDGFYDKFPDGRIITHIIEHDREAGFILVRAEAYRNGDDAMPASTGHAFELRTEGYVNKTSYIENCETGAVGRALANLNFKAKRGSIASREEMEKVDRMEAAKPSRFDTPRSAQPMGSEDKWLCGVEKQKQAVDMELAAAEKEGKQVSFYRAKFKEQRGYAVWQGKAEEIEKYVVWLAEKANPF